MKFKIKILNSLWILIVSLVLAAPPVFAQDCQTEIDAVQKLLVDSKAIRTNIDVIQVENLIGEAISLCNAGDEQGALQKLAEAKTLLAVL